MRPLVAHIESEAGRASKLRNTLFLSSMFKSTTYVKRPLFRHLVVRFVSALKGLKRLISINLGRGSTIVSCSIFCWFKNTQILAIIMQLRDYEPSMTSNSGVDD
ncbi:hypothetical protein ACNR90_005397 [Candidozyma auris]